MKEDNIKKKDSKPVEVPSKKVERNAGKGDSPRNISERFRKNYDHIDWGHGRKRKK